MNRKALVVGGSGMLAEVCLWLAEEGYHVSVVGRDKGKLQRLRDNSSHPDAFTLLDVDYHQAGSFQKRISELLLEQGHIDLVVSWIHSSGREALLVLQQELSRQKQEWRMFHVCGSGSWKNPPVVMDIGLGNYRRIILGFVLESHASRWLTNREISQGVIQAIRSDEEQYIVGVVEPWEKRPE